MRALNLVHTGSGDLRRVDRTVLQARAVVVAALSILLCTASPAEPLHDHDNGPLSGIFGMPDSTEGAAVLAKGNRRWDTTFSTSSHSVLADAPAETLTLDGETRRLSLDYRHGLGGGWEIGMEVPYLWHESGGLDEFIDDWHRWFGLPDGSRDMRPIDELEFFYADAGGTRVAFTGNSHGVGDVRLFGGWQFATDADRSLALRLGVKLPTGDSGELAGSGGTDVSIGFAADYAQLFGIPGLDGFYRVSAIHVGEPDLLADLYKKVVGHLSFGIGYRLNDTVELRVQSVSRTALYESDLENLGEVSSALVFGGHIDFSESLRLSIAVAEDVKVMSAPDVTFQLSLRYMLRGPTSAPRRGQPAGKT